MMRKNAWFLGIMLGAIFCVSNPALAAVARVQPETAVRFVIKDRPYKETLTELFKLTNLKVQFAKDVNVDQNVSIDVESVRWGQLVTAVLDAYKMNYRYVSADTVEVYRQ